jgi:hypothetical protein
MRSAFVFLFLLLPIQAFAGPVVDWVSTSVIYTNQGCNGGWPSLCLGWQPWQHVWTVSGDAAQGNSPDDVASACNKSWLEATIGSPTWSGTAWTLDVAVRGYGTGDLKSGACGLFIDLENEGTVPVSFE